MTTILTTATIRTRSASKKNARSARKRKRSGTRSTVVVTMTLMTMLTSVDQDLAAQTKGESPARGLASSSTAGRRARAPVQSAAAMDQVTDKKGLTARIGANSSLLMEGLKSLLMDARKNLTPPAAMDLASRNLLDILDILVVSRNLLDTLVVSRNTAPVICLVDSARRNLRDMRSLSSRATVVAVAMTKRSMVRGGRNMARVVDIGRKVMAGGIKCSGADSTLMARLRLA